MRRSEVATLVQASNTLPKGGGEPARRSPVGPIVAVLLVVAVLALLFATLPVADWLRQFQGWVRGLGPSGYLLYAVVYAACVVLFVPASILTLGAGAIYGVTVGVGVVLAGATVGATLAFLLARTLLRARVERMTEGNARFRALDRAIAKEGAKIVFLVRLAPVFPFTYINYAFGLTGVPTGSYVLASVIGMIPGTFAYVYLGSAAASAAGAAGGGADLTRTIVQVAGAIAALVATIFVARVATRAIRSAGVEERAG
ncbi:MAG: TVP38/TMEM64 family protein [Thermodesulfobacteriota bacterium]